MAGMVLHPRLLLGGDALRNYPHAGAQLLRQGGDVDRHCGGRADGDMQTAGRRHHEGAEGSKPLRLCNRPHIGRSPDSPIPRHHMLGNRQELALGLTLVIIIMVGGQEIASLVHPAAALTVTLTACLSVVLAARAA